MSYDTVTQPGPRGRDERQEMRRRQRVRDRCVSPKLTLPVAKRVVGAAGVNFAASLRRLQRVHFAASLRRLACACGTGDKHCNKGSAAQSPQRHAICAQNSGMAVSNKNATGLTSSNAMKRCYSTRFVLACSATRLLVSYRPLGHSMSRCILTPRMPLSLISDDLINRIGVLASQRQPPVHDVHDQPFGVGPRPGCLLVVEKSCRSCRAS